MCIKSYVDGLVRAVDSRRENFRDPLLDRRTLSEILSSQEYKEYCKIYKVENPESEKEIGMYLIWESFNKEGKKL